MKFVDNKWKVISQNERLQLTKTDGQVFSKLFIWVCVWTLVLSTKVQTHIKFKVSADNVGNWSD